ncbi:MAG: lantibiotic dehydratase, partial [Alphaproteobacteria bacterium]
MERTAPAMDREAAPHLVELADGWRLWRTIRLRGAGFPVDLLEALAAPAAARSGRRLLACEQDYEAACHEAESVCRAQVAAADDAARKRWLHAARRFAKGKLPDDRPDSPAGPDYKRVELRAEALEAARAEAHGAIAAASEHTRERIRDVARDPRFREAVTWQNRQALKHSIDGLLQALPGAANARVRSHEQLLVKYLERYCAKNESIGFFGPVGWAQFSDRGPPIDMRPGPALLADRLVRFEYWAIDELAKALGTDPRIRPWLAPRLNPQFRVEGPALIDAREKAHPLPPGLARALSLCTGEIPAHAIAERCASDPALGFAGGKAVLGALGAMASQKMITWDLDVPVAPHPERRLRVILDGIGDAELRAHTIAALDTLENGLAKVAAAGDAEALASALEELESAFTRLTRKEAVHHQGLVYAGRTLVYEDCRRDIALALGPETRARLAAPLSLVLQSARWYCGAVGERFDSVMRQAFASLGRAYGASVPFTAFWHTVLEQRGALQFAVQQAAAELAKRWAALLAVPPEARGVDRRASQLKAAVMAAFPAAGPGWTNARYHSPDIMIAAAGADAIARGDYRFVLGEIHTGCNMVMPPWVLELHPDPDALIAARDRDLAAPLVFTVTPRHYLGHRKAPDSFSESDFQLAYASDPPWRAGRQLLRLADLVVEREGKHLTVRTRDNRTRLPAMAFFEGVLIGASLSEFALLPRFDHTPRVTIDDLVAARETWRFPAAGLRFAGGKTTEDRFIG